MAISLAQLREEYGDKIARRKNEYSTALSLYIKLAGKDVNGAIQVRDNAADTMAYLYFSWHYVLVKPFIKDLCDRYKVASLTEFAICYLQPLYVAGFAPEQLRTLNADFAFFCAFNIMANFSDEQESVHFGTPHTRTFSGAIAPLEDRMEKILENHKRYLATFDDTNKTPPVISNAHCLELIDMFYTFQ